MYYLHLSLLIDCLHLSFVILLFYPLISHVFLNLSTLPSATQLIKTFVISLTCRHGQQNSTWTGREGLQNGQTCQHTRWRIQQNARVLAREARLAANLWASIYLFWWLFYFGGAKLSGSRLDFNVNTFQQSWDFFAIMFISETNYL